MKRFFSSSRGSSSANNNDIAENVDVAASRAAASFNDGMGSISSGYSGGGSEEEGGRRPPASRKTGTLYWLKDSLPYTFVLYGNVLTAVATDGYDDGTLPSIVLDPETTVTAARTDSDTSFVIKNPAGDTLTLRAAAISDQEYWINALRDAIPSASAESTRNARILRTLSSKKSLGRIEAEKLKRLMVNLKNDNVDVVAPSPEGSAVVSRRRLRRVSSGIASAGGSPSRRPLVGVGADAMTIAKALETLVNPRAAQVLVDCPAPSKGNDTCKYDRMPVAIAKGSFVNVLRYRGDDWVEVELLRRHSGSSVGVLPSQSVEIMPPVAHADTMWKLSSNQKNWHLRNFRISSGVLMYRRDAIDDDDDGNDESVDGSQWCRYFAFTLDTRLSRVHDDEHAHCFQLVHPIDRVYLRAKTETEMVKWMRLFQRCVAQANYYADEIPRSLAQRITAGKGSKIVGKMTRRLSSIVKRRFLSKRSSAGDSSEEIIHMEPGRPQSMSISSDPPLVTDMSHGRYQRHRRLATEPPMQLRLCLDGNSDDDLDSENVSVSDRLSSLQNAVYERLGSPSSPATPPPPPPFDPELYKDILDVPASAPPPVPPLPTEWPSTPHRDSMLGLNTPQTDEAALEDAVQPGAVPQDTKPKLKQRPKIPPRPSRSSSVVSTASTSGESKTLNDTLKERARRQSELSKRLSRRLSTSSRLSLGSRPSSERLDAPSSAKRPLMSSSSSSPPPLASQCELSTQLSRRLSIRSQTSQGSRPSTSGNNSNVASSLTSPPPSGVTSSDVKQNVASSLTPPPPPPSSGAAQSELSRKLSRRFSAVSQASSPPPAAKKASTCLMFVLDMTADQFNVCKNCGKLKKEH